MKALDGIIVDTDLDTWKTYLTWTTLNNTASRLTRDLDKQNFEFYRQDAVGHRGATGRLAPRVNTVNGTLGEVVGKVYVKQHFPPEAKERMLELVGNLVKAYEKSIKELDWMGERPRRRRSTSCRSSRRRLVTRTYGATTRAGLSRPTTTTAT